MEPIFCQKPAVSADEKMFVDLVLQSETKKLRAFLQERPGFPLDEQWFSFDKPAIVQARNDRKLVDLLLEHGADIQARSGWEEGSYGVLNETEPEMFRYLLERGAELDIHAACEHNLQPEVKRFLERDPALVNQRGPDGQMPLHYAASTELAKMLLEAGADPNARCLDHNSSAAEYAAADRPEIARFLLSRGGDCDIFLACALGDQERAKALVAKDPGCLSLRLGEGFYDGHIFCWKLGARRRPLQVAAERGHNALVESLKHHLPRRERFLLACWLADKEEVERLLQEDAQLLESLGPEEFRLVADAAWEGRTEAVRVMLEAGFPVDSPGDHQCTPLDRACLEGHLETVRCLLEYGPSFTVKNEFGGVPLSGALWGAENWAPRDHVGAARLLLEAGAAGDPADDRDGDRGLGVLLAWMARAGEEEMVRLLLEFGAPVDSVSRDGTPAVELARRGGHTEILELLN